MQCSVVPNHIPDSFYLCILGATSSSSSGRLRWSRCLSRSLSLRRVPESVLWVRECFRKPAGCSCGCWLTEANCVVWFQSRAGASTLLSKCSTSTATSRWTKRSLRRYSLSRSYLLSTGILFWVQACDWCFCFQYNKSNVLYWVSRVNIMNIPLPPPILAQWWSVSYQDWKCSPHSRSPWQQLKQSPGVIILFIFFPQSCTSMGPSL